MVTAHELSQILEVSERTVYRDVQSLILSGIPIEGEAGVGYVLRRGMELPPLMFTNEEAKALVLGARMVQAWGDPLLERAAKRVLEKIDAVAPPAVQKELAARTLQAPQFHIDREMRERLGLVRQSIDERRKLRFAYERADGEQTQRTVRPLTGDLHLGRGQSGNLVLWILDRQTIANRLGGMSIDALRHLHQRGHEELGRLRLSLCSLAIGADHSNGAKAHHWNLGHQHGAGLVGPCVGGDRPEEGRQGGLGFDRIVHLAHDLDVFSPFDKRRGL